MRLLLLLFHSECFTRFLLFSFRPFLLLLSADVMMSKILKHNSCFTHVTDQRCSCVVSGWQKPINKKNVGKNSDKFLLLQLLFIVSSNHGAFFNRSLALSFFGGRCSYRCRFRTKTQTHEDRECVFSLLNSPKMLGHKAMNHTKKATHALTKVDKKIRSQCSNFTTFVYNCQSKICLSLSLTAKTELVFVEVFLLFLLSLVSLIRCHGLCWRSLFSASILLANGMCMWLFLKSVIPFLWCQQTKCAKCYIYAVQKLCPHLKWV